MTTSTRNEPDDPSPAARTTWNQPVQGKARTAVRCRLCREMIVLESNFRPTAAACPHCGLKFVFDPDREPLPVRGLRLRYADVLEAQRHPGTVQRRRHDAHCPPAVQPPQPRTNYLAWIGGLALVAAGALTLFSGWFHRLLTH